ncbi:hypothetical protein [Paraburkholderia hayleyella]|uniref:hypothetical protein n=1 Tax=Paraburkholderia hayleyella TaxID=2152889 RepID=UPI001291C6F3|nr:hypothetical protein [Paraburkholderia hayleyella]
MSVKRFCVTTHIQSVTGRQAFIFPALSFWIGAGPAVDAGWHGTRRMAFGRWGKYCVTSKGEAVLEFVSDQRCHQCAMSFRGTGIDSKNATHPGREF